MKDTVTLGDSQRRRDAIDAATWWGLRWLFTYMMGRRAASEPAGQANVHLRVALPFVLLAAGISMSLSAFSHAPIVMPFWLFSGWTLTVGSARDLQLSIFHHAAHENVISRAVSLWLGRAIGTLLVIEPFDSYAPKHRKDHHGRHTVSTDVDPTVIFLTETVGLVPGETAVRNFRRFLVALISPRVHFKMTMARLLAQFGPEAGWANRLVTGAYLASLGFGFSVAYGVLPFAVAVILPMTVGYQAASIARLAVEHLWPASPPANGKRDMQEHDMLTVAVRFLPPIPERWTLGSVSWFAAHCMVQTWVRFTILPGDSGPNHGWHHGEARGDWVNHVDAAAAWERRRREKTNCDTIEAWSYAEALALAMDSFEQASWDSLMAPAQFKIGKAS